MSTLPVAHYLRDIGSEPGRGRGQNSRSEFMTTKSPEFIAAVEAARARGAAKSRAAAEAELRERLAQAKAAAEADMTAARQRWVAEEGERLTSQMLAALADMEARISAQAARILLPVLRAEVAQRAVAGIAEAFDGLHSKGDLTRVEVAGPQDLVEKIRDHLTGKAANLSFHISGDCDLRVTVDETVLETRIGAWVRAIDGEPG